MMEKQKHIIAHICLTDGTVRCQQTDEALLRCCLGGRGLGMHLLAGSADAAPLIFLTGPLTEAHIPPGGRYCAVTRCTDTGKPFSLSSGTGWGAALKQAGLDGIVIEGEAPEWVCLTAEQGKVQLHSAKSYLGMLCSETEKAMRAAFGPGSSVLSIGPAGENRVPQAAIICDSERAFSRAGIGKNMGMKKLKAIVIPAENAGDLPANACEHCGVSCRNDPASHRAAGGISSDFAALCNEYGLDCLGAARVIEGLGEPEEAAYADWIREISCPKTTLAVPAGSCLQAAKTPRERPKANFSREMTAALDSMGCCLFSAALFSPEELAGMLSEAAGMLFHPEDLIQSGAKTLELEESLAEHQPGESAR